MRKIIIFIFCIILLVSSVFSAETKVIFKAKDTGVLTYDEAEFIWNGKEWLVTITGLGGAEDYPAKDIEKLVAVNSEIVMKAKELVKKGNPMVEPPSKDLTFGGVGHMCDEDLFLYCKNGLVCVDSICQLVTSSRGTSGVVLPEELKEKNIEFNLNQDFINLGRGTSGVISLIDKTNLIEYEDVESLIQSESLEKGDYLLFRNSPDEKDLLFFTLFYVGDNGIKIKVHDFDFDLSVDKDLPIDGEYDTYVLNVIEINNDIYRMTISPEFVGVPVEVVTGLFESIAGVLEKVNILMKLTVQFNSIDYSYKMVVEQTYDNKIGVKALFDEAILYRRLAEMKNNYERVGPKELEREKIKRVPVKEPPKPKEPITAESAPATPIARDEEFDIYGKELTLERGEFVDLKYGTSLGLYGFDEALAYKDDGEYIYFGFDTDEGPTLIYINIEDGNIIDKQQLNFFDEGEELVGGLYRIVLIKSEDERATINALNIEDIPEMEVEEEIIPLAEREGNLEDLKDVPYDAIVKFIEDNGLDLDDVEYMTRILNIERGEACDPKWNKERGAIAQVVINRIYSGAFPTTVKDVVRADQIPGAARWFETINKEIDNEDRGIKSMNSRGCVLSALRFFMCQGEEDAGAKMIGGRTGFAHRFRLKDIPEWNKINQVQVQDERDAATFSGDDTSDKECSLRNYRGTGPVSDVRKLEGLCFPLERESFDKSLNDWGNNRGPKRCHAGIDLLTKNPGRVIVADNGVIAIDDGVVTNIFGFTNCKDGWSGPGKVIALLIYHQNLGKTVNYGEIDKDGLAANIKVGDKITKGQYLGRAGHCGMLHLELYKGQQAKNIRWLPPSGSVATGYRNKCAKEFLSTKPVALEDPSNFVKALDFCPSSEPLV